MIPGIHASVGGGPCAALETFARLALPAGQVFTSNQQQWKGRTVPDGENGIFSRPGGPLVIAHASYLINLASTRPDVAQKSITALLEELLRMRTLGIRWLVMHPGAHLGAGPEAGLEMVAAGVASVLGKIPGNSGILFENTAGQGTTLGASFQELSHLLDLTGMPGRTGVCLDTCHAFAAGYDLSTPGAVRVTMDEADGRLGLDRVLAFHMNDSLTPVGSRRDRHARIGEGMIGLAPLRALAEMEVFRDVPAVCEAPGTDDDRAEDIRLLLP
jgi:deoxyribonuclease IV